eukprot:scaffold105363_cov15-Prasinocladus_malaysianus.AAC.1
MSLRGAALHRIALICIASLALHRIALSRIGLRFISLHATSFSPSHHVARILQLASESGGSEIETRFWLAVRGRGGATDSIKLSVMFRCRLLPGVKLAVVRGTETTMLSSRVEFCRLVMVLLRPY